MKRTIFGIIVGLGITLLLFLPVYAWAINPSVWTFGAAVVMGFINGTLWVGFGRALYDVFVSREDY
jgi:hypothetical protein